MSTRVPLPGLLSGQLGPWRLGVHTANQGNWPGRDIPRGQEDSLQVKGERNRLAGLDRSASMISSFNPLNRPAAHPSLPNFHIRIGCLKGTAAYRLLHLPQSMTRTLQFQSIWECQMEKKTKCGLRIKETMTQITSLV